MRYDDWLQEPLKGNDRRVMAGARAHDRRDRMWEITAWIEGEDVQLEYAHVKLLDGSVFGTDDIKVVEKYLGDIRNLDFDY